MYTHFIVARLNEFVNVWIESILSVQYYSCFARGMQTLLYIIDRACHCWKFIQEAVNYTDCSVLELLFSCLSDFL